MRYALITLLLVGSALAQPKPRIDFDQLLAAFPNLPWNFEIRYVTHSDADTDALRIYYNGRIDLVRWRSEYPGSLAQVCHAQLEQPKFRDLLELFRARHFNDLPSDPPHLKTVANRNDDAIISVRLEHTVVRKLDRHENNSPDLKSIEERLDAIKTFAARSHDSKCDLESVPEQP